MARERYFGQLHPRVEKLAIITIAAIVFVPLGFLLCYPPERPLDAAPPDSAQVGVAELRRIENRIIRLESSAQRREDASRFAAQAAGEAKEKMQLVEDQLAYLRNSQDQIRIGIVDIQDSIREHILQTERRLPLLTDPPAVDPRKIK